MSWITGKPPSLAAAALSACVLLHGGEATAQGRILERFADECRRGTALGFVRGKAPFDDFIFQWTGGATKGHAGRKSLGCGAGLRRARTVKAVCHDATTAPKFAFAKHRMVPVRCWPDP